MLRAIIVDDEILVRATLEKNGGLGGRGLSACGLLRQWTGRVGGYGAVSGGPCVHRYQNARLQRAGIHRRRACPGPCAPHRSAQRFR